MSSTREVAYDVVMKWKRDIGQVVKYEQMIADIDAALQQREQEVRAAEREACINELKSVLHGALFQSASFMGRDRSANQVADGIGQCIAVLRDRTIRRDSEQEGDR
jgi:hypothetical protein